MKLELMKNEIESNFQAAFGEYEIRYNFLKNMIKKDLEVVLWQNKTIKVLGEFQIYSDFKSELNSFDYVVSFLTDQHVEFADDSIESYTKGAITPLVSQC